MSFRTHYKSDEDIAHDLDSDAPLPLYLWSSRRASIQERFERFDERHPVIYGEFRAIARDLYSRGIKHYGSKAILEVLRYNRLVSGRDVNEPFKINNDFSSRLARHRRA